jgi:hypothetical protein
MADHDLSQPYFGRIADTVTVYAVGDVDPGFFGLRYYPASCRFCGHQGLVPVQPEPLHSQVPSGPNP